MNRGWSMWVKVYRGEIMLILNISFEAKEASRVWFQRRYFPKIEIRKMI